MKLWYSYTFFSPIVFIFCFIVFISHFVQAATLDELERDINQKTEEIKKINEEVQKTQEKIDQTERQQRSLRTIINQNNYSINQLTLGIKSNEINIEKLGLEIESLKITIKDTENTIQFRTEAIKKILLELYIKDNEGVATTFLKNQSLSDGLNEIYELREVHTSLADNVRALHDLKDSLDDTLSKVSHKKGSIEQEYSTTRIKKSILEKQRSERRDLLALASTQSKKFERELDELLERQTRIAEEIEDLESTLRQNINPSLIPGKHGGVLSWPVEDGFKKITQEYGATRFARYGYAGRWHNGIDIGAPLGTPLLAAADGVVVSVGDQDRSCPRGAYGKYVVIRHENNLVTLYGHLSQYKSSAGDRVKRGEVIGYMGRTGYSTGSHLHFTVYDGNTFDMRKSKSCGPMPSGGDINPSDYL